MTRANSTSNISIISFYSLTFQGYVLQDSDAKLHFHVQTET